MVTRNEKKLAVACAVHDIRRDRPITPEVKWKLVGDTVVFMVTIHGCGAATKVPWDTVDFGCSSGDMTPSGLLYQILNLGCEAVEQVILADALSFLSEDLDPDDIEGTVEDD